MKRSARFKQNNRRKRNNRIHDGNKFEMHTKLAVNQALDMFARHFFPFSLKLRGMLTLPYNTSHRFAEIRLPNLKQLTVALSAFEFKTPTGGHMPYGRVISVQIVIENWSIYCVVEFQWKFSN